MNDEQFNRALYDLVERITQAELRSSSKKLLENYFNESLGATAAERARQTVERYTQQELPSHAELAQRRKSGASTAFDELVIRLELAAERWWKSRGLRH